MKALRNIFWFIYSIVAVYSLIVVILIYGAFTSNWVAGFMMMSFPIVVLVNLLAVVFWSVTEPKRALLPLIILAVAGIFLSRTFVFSESDPVQVGKRTFKVANYNIRNLRLNENRYAQKDEDIQGLRTWLFTSDADVLCLPEYYSEKRTGQFRTTEQLVKHRYRYYRVMDQGNTREHYMGLAVFSRFPVIASRDTVFESQNGLIQADIKVFGDTVRIVAVHLFSMALKLSTLVHQKQLNGFRNEAKITFRQMKTGFIHRARESEVLASWVRKSPYPVIVCGDFNETPYGYVYGQTRSYLANAFEVKGQGFGFTFNQLPYFIRIDHQFYDADKLRLLDFRTLNTVKYSDHYPLTGVYEVIHGSKD